MIIGFIGFKQIGKSTAAKYLQERYGFERHNMKDALVAEIKANFPDLLAQMVIDGRDLGFKSMNFNELFEEKPPLMRALLQNYGTEVRRKDDDRYWVNQWLKEGANIDNVVTDDVRFKNEASAVKGQGGILIRLTRPDITTGGAHASEMEQTEIVADHTIDCKPGDLESLYRELDKIYEKEI